MKSAPTEITIAKLEVVVMPNGEVICLGQSLGWVKTLGKHLTAVTDPTSRENVAVKCIEELASYMTIAELRRESSKRFGLDFDEALQMAYENMLQTAKLTRLWLSRKRKKK